MAVEGVWWAACRSAGTAPTPLLFTYLALAFAGLGGAYALRLALSPDRPRSAWPSLIAGTVLIGIGASLLLPLKYAIPQQIPFWLDGPLASAERALFGGDPWLGLDRLLGWAIVPIDRIYGLWLPVQLLALFSLMLEPPSRAKSRALMAYSLAWFVLGVVAATLASSAGPIFFDRLVGGSQFADLGDMLRERGAWMVLGESEPMWTALASGNPGAVAGISAFPSLHVAISVWMYLVARSMAPRAAPIALAYAVFMWIASVQLGWHYASDGLAGALGMIGIWAAVGAAERRLAPGARPR